MSQPEANSPAQNKSNNARNFCIRFNLGENPALFNHNPSIARVLTEVDVDEVFICGWFSACAYLNSRDMLNLLPFPRSCVRSAGRFVIPERAVAHFESALPRDEVLLPLADRLQETAGQAGVALEIVTGPPTHPRLAFRFRQSNAAPNHPEGYALTIDRRGVAILYRQVPGLRAGIATLRQLLREHGRRLPRLRIRDYPDFLRRGFMLDISRGRVPKLETLLGLLDHLADFKINEVQLYTEHTFAYREYEPVWRGWGALGGEEILRLDAAARTLGIELVPNQNSFGHLRYWLEYPPLKKLAEVSEPYEDGGGSFLRFPSTLAPNHSGTLPFLRGLYDDLLPHFSSDRFNVGCDETWDLGRGQSASLCRAKGKGVVYADFLKRIYAEVARRGRQMMFWGDIILHYPELIRTLPKDAIALNWGYEADHPWDKEAGQFATSGMAFYVCPGTSTWMSLIGRNDNAFTNLQRAAEAGRRYGATGYLNTDWGDGGHPQPLAVSYAPLLLGAALSWCAETSQEALLARVLNRDVFADTANCLGPAALALGKAHRLFHFTAPNVTPFGAVIAAPKAGSRELFCRDGLKYFASIKARHIEDALEEVERQRLILGRAKPASPLGSMLQWELDMAARMAAQSCRFMLWQQAKACGRQSRANQMARQGIRDLRELDAEFRAYWPKRNKGTTEKCSSFLAWRMEDYRHGA